MHVRGLSHGILSVNKDSRESHNVGSLIRRRHFTVWLHPHIPFGSSIVPLRPVPGDVSWYGRCVNVSANEIRL